MGIRNKLYIKKTCFVLFLILFIFILYIPKLIPNTNKEIDQIEILKPSSKIEHLNIQWIDNPTFEDLTENPWFSNKTGDMTDVAASMNSGQANFEILGNVGLFSNISGTPNASVWKEFNNTYFILPDDLHEINEKGCEAAHTFQENIDQSRNRPSVHWRRNMTMPVDMSDYIITSVSVSAVVNGSADTNLETPTDNLDIGEPSYSGFATYYDYARFYIKVSNLDYEKLYEIAYYKTVDLGIGNQTRQGSGVMNYLNDTFMAIINEPKLLFYLTKALEKDPYHFGVTLGIDIYCEDNYDNLDLDIFYSLLIKSVNLSFTYEKKMNQKTTVSWNQITNMINGSNVEITEANFNFNYKISEFWNGSLSPNSKIIILVNNFQHSESINLSLATINFQEAKTGGYDLTDIVNPYENLTISIQIFIGDEFGLSRTIYISIDNVYLEISYTETFPESRSIPEPLIFRILLIVASLMAITLGGYLIAYQRILKYPRPVRKVKKYGRSLNKKTPPSTEIISREIAFKKSYSLELKKTSKYLKGKAAIVLIEKKGGVP